MTPRQRELLTYLRERNAVSDVSPSLREMAAAIGCSESWACELLKALKKQRLVRTTPGQRRSVQVVGGKLTPTELAWCERNVGRVRAAMQMDARGGVETRAEGRVAA